MRIAVIINKSAGSGRSKKSVISAFEKRNIEVEAIEIPDDNIKDKILSDGKSNFDIIAAAGGDGTINSVVNFAAEIDIPMGIIPGGTFNHFAKDSGIPLDIEKAIDAIVRQYIIKVDIAEVNNHYFINNSSVGIYPKMVKHRDKEMNKPGYSKWYAVFRAILNIFFIKYPLVSLNIRTENHYNEVTTPFIFIGNNIYTMNIFIQGNRDKIDEGVLSLYYPETPGKFSLIRFAFLALINKLNQAKDFHTVVCREVKINSRKRNLEVSVDGEVLHLETPLEYRIHPRKLKLIVPEAK